MHAHAAGLEKVGNMGRKTESSTETRESCLYTLGGCAYLPISVIVGSSHRMGSSSSLMSNLNLGAGSFQNCCCAGSRVSAGAWELASCPAIQSTWKRMGT